jgi:hypothetical protein
MAGTDNWGQARVYYQRAAQEDPTVRRWMKLADAASKTGAHIEAADALARAGRGRGPDPKLRTRIDEERRRALLRQLSAPK